MPGGMQSDPVPPRAPPANRYSIVTAYKMSLSARDNSDNTTLATLVTFILSLTEWLARCALARTLTTFASSPTRASRDTSGLLVLHAGV